VRVVPPPFIIATINGPDSRCRLELDRPVKDFRGILFPRPESEPRRVKLEGIASVIWDPIRVRIDEAPLLVCLHYLDGGALRSASSTQAHKTEVLLRLVQIGRTFRHVCYTDTPPTGVRDCSQCIYRPLQVLVRWGRNGILRQACNDVS
jgi:hypothetical protein